VDVVPLLAAVALSGPIPTGNTLELDYSRAGGGTLRGVQTLEFENRGTTSLDRVWLRLWANGRDGCRRRHIRVSVDPPNTAEPLRVRCSALPVRLGAPVAPQARGGLVLRWRVRLRRIEDRFGLIERISLFGNVVPLLAVTDQRGLHLERYVGGGEAFYSLAAPWTATLRLPARLHAATTGTVGSEQVAGGVRTLRVSTPSARDFSLAIGRMRARTTNVAGVRVLVWARRHRRATRGMLRAARRAVSRYSSRFGPYGSSELEVVETPGLGMEYPELVFSDAAQFVVAHEIAHQWWYGIVGNDQFREPWLDESFASWSDHLLYGGFGHCRTRRPYDFLPPGMRRVRLDSTMGYFRRHFGAYGGVVYEGGACALHSLERAIGRSRMTTFLRLLVSRFRFGVETKADLLQALAEAAPGFRVERFLRTAHLR
jgi:Peptidase family M1 domain